MTQKASLASSLVPLQANSKK